VGVDGRAALSDNPRMPKKTTKKAKGPKTDDALFAAPTTYADAPDMPVDVAIREWRQLASVARKLQGPLGKIGLDKTSATTLGSFADDLDARERHWQKTRPSPGKVKKLRAEAETLKRSLLAAGEWALRDDEDGLDELARIREGTGLVDTLNDLRDLAAFWKTNASSLSKTRLKSADVARAPALATELGTLADEEHANTDAAQALELRNRCFWSGDAAAKEIRKAGRYAFHDQPKVAARFSSRYQADKSKVETVRRRKGASAGATDPSAGGNGTSAAKS
jgi:hypothetical protein